MKALKLFGLGALVLIFQTTLLKLFEFYQVGPDLSLIFIVWCALQYGPLAGLLSGFFVGLIFDVYSYQEYLGAGMIVKSCLGYFIGLADDHVIQLEWSTKVMILAICFFLHDMFYNILIGINNQDMTSTMLKSTLPEAIYTIIVASLIFNLYSRKTDVK